MDENEEIEEHPKIKLDIIYKKIEEKKIDFKFFVKWYLPLKKNISKLEEELAKLWSDKNIISVFENALRNQYTKPLYGYWKAFDENSFDNYEKNDVKFSEINEGNFDQQNAFARLNYFIVIMNKKSFGKPTTIDNFIQKSFSSAEEIQNLKSSLLAHEYSNKLQTEQLTENDKSFILLRFIEYYNIPVPEVRKELQKEVHGGFVEQTNVWKKFLLLIYHDKLSLLPSYEIDKNKLQTLINNCPSNFIDASSIISLLQEKKNK